MVLFIAHARVSLLAVAFDLCPDLMSGASHLAKAKVNWDWRVPMLSLRCYFYYIYYDYFHYFD